MAGVDNQALLGEKHRPHGEVERLRASHCEYLVAPPRGGHSERPQIATTVPTAQGVSPSRRGVFGLRERARR